MQTAVASLPLPGMPAAVPAVADAAAEGTAAVDFSALLLGQLVGQIAKDILPPATTGESAPTDATNTTAAEGVVDPTQLLAAMGLVLDPRGPQFATPSQAAGDVLPSAPVTGATPAPLGASPAANLPQAASATALPPAADDGQPAAFAVPAHTPANFAGSEPKLAEPAAETIAEPGMHAPASHAPTPAPSRAAGDALQVATPVKDPAWPAEFSQKVVWMATQDKQNAQITLNPPQMGPIEISLSVKNDQASALFVSANAEVREVIEAALPRLREMLAGVGVELGQANVSAESFRQAQEQAAGERRGGGDGPGDVRVAAQERSIGAASGAAIRAGNGLVDTFA